MENPKHIVFFLPKAGMLVNAPAKNSAGIGINAARSNFPHFSLLSASSLSLILSKLIILLELDT